MALTRIKVLDANSNINITSANITNTLTVSGNLVAGNVTTTSSGGSVNVPKISSIVVTNSSFVANGSTAVSNTGGYIVVNGTGFVSGAVVLLGTKTASATTFANSNALLVQVPAQVDGTYPVYVTNPDGGVAISVPGLTYNDLPVWSTGSTLPGGGVNSSISIQLAATDTTSVNYSLASGSTLPTGLSLSTSGLLSGTVTGISGTTVYSFGVVATDTYLQTTQQTFSITISVGDTYFPYTSLLLSASTNSANTSGSSNANTVIDSSNNYNNIVRSGNPGQGTFTPFGTNWSNYFDGSTGYLFLGGPSQFAFGTNPFTIELWVYITVYSATAGPIYDLRPSGSGNPSGYLNINFSPSGNLRIYNAGTILITSSSTVPLNTWTHISISRDSGNNNRMFFNGQQVGSAVDSTSWGNATNRPIIGTDGNSPLSAGYIFNGYMSNLRVVNGTALYTANFTPSTSPLTVVANTALLTCQSNRFADANTTPATITANGAVSVQRFNPFGVNGVSYNTSANTYVGSTYFDGSTGYLALPLTNAFAIGTGDFTVEAWVYPSSAEQAYSVIIAGITFGSSSDWSLFCGNATTPLYPMFQFTNNTSDRLISTVAVSQNAWSHIAVTRQSGSAKIFVNGVVTGSGTFATQSLLNSITKGIGAASNGNASTTFAGYISNLRVINGTAVYTANFTPSTTPLTVIANTALLTCQSTQTVTYDANTTPNSITTSGTPRPNKNIPFTLTDTSTAATTYGGSYYFNSSTDYLQIPSSSNFAFSGPFTVEAWFYWPVTPTFGNPLIGVQTNGGFQFYLNVGATLGFNIYGSGNICATSSFPSTNAWHHIAMTRNASNICTIWIDGANSASATSSTSFVQGAWTIYGGGSGGGSGYVSNLRVVNGTAVYTANFTPPTAPLSAPANTALLLSGTNSGVYDSTTINDFVNIGGVSVNSNVKQYGTNSYYFNGTNSGFSIPYSPGLNLMSGANFTIEAWVYPTTNSGTVTPIIAQYVQQTGSQAWILATTGSNFRFDWAPYNTNTQLLTSSGTFTVNQWTHVALVKNGSTFTFYINGTSSGSATNASTQSALPAVPISLGNYFASGVVFGASGATWYAGYMQDVRITNGIARYTSNFTPTATPFLAQ